MTDREMKPADREMKPAAEDTFYVDLVQGGVPGRFSGYLVAAPRPALIESGSARDVEIWLDALDRMGVPRSDVAYVVVTHVHLDHGGGAGVLLKELPSARLVVHRAGARHMVDPTRLVQGSRAVFGQRLERLFGLPQPAPEARVDAVDDGDSIDLGGGHRLRFLEGRGHARHQHMILDEGTGMLFPGDELGVRYLPACRPGRDYVLPSTVPNQFDPEAMLASVDRVRALRPEGVLFSHFGRLESPLDVLLDRIAGQVHAFVGLLDGADAPLPAEEVHRRLERHVRADLEAQELDWTPELAASLDMDVEVCAMGLADYHARRVGASG